MQILVADEDPDTRALLATTLGSWGFEVFTAGTGAAAFDTLTAREPRLAILDWMLPGIDGIEICRRVWLEPSLSPPYIILLTDRTNQVEVVAALLEAGADDYMRKPVDADELRARVTVAMRLLEAKAESERLLSAISSILIGIDETGRITRWNAMASDTFSIAPAQSIGRT
jgi:DNA-binding response OmpR family regulator